MTLSERPLEYCPWGCGQKVIEHSSSRVCPPADARGVWLNSPTKAYGATEQLKQDVAAMREAKRDCCASCQKVIQQRIDVLQAEVSKRGYYGR